MTPQRKKEHFIELRSQGLSFDSISREIKVSKQTVINWSRELKIELQNAQAINRDALFEKLKIGVEQRLTSFASFQRRLELEFESRNLSDLTVNKS